MKTDIKDTTFLILVRLDSVQRIENLCLVVDFLYKYFHTNIFIWEVAPYRTGLLEKILNKKVVYQFIEDKDPILHKTKYYNEMILNVKTPFLAIWDTDTIVDHKYIIESIQLLHSETADVVYPYNGRFMDTSMIIRELFMKKRKVATLNRHINKMVPLYNKILYGGGVFFNRDKFMWAGLDNELYYGWGDEDFDRFVRCKTLGLKIQRTNNYMFHLSHPRGLNSSYQSDYYKELSSNLLQETINSSEKELKQYYSINP